jgi:hypothetical protein
MQNAPPTPPSPDKKKEKQPEPESLIETEAPVLPPAAPDPIAQRPGAAQPSDYRQEKAPALAVLLSFCMPGLGHLYAEAYERAAMIFVGFIMMIFAAVQGAFPIALCVLASIFLWFFGMFDSYREVQLVNLGAEAPEPAPRRRGEGRLVFGVFLLVVGGLLLVRNLDLFEIDWLLEWWPALVVLVGLYLIIDAARGRKSTSGGDDYQ